MSNAEAAVIVAAIAAFVILRVVEAKERGAEAAGDAAGRAAVDDLARRAERAFGIPERTFDF